MNNPTNATTNSTQSYDPLLEQAYNWFQSNIGASPLTVKDEESFVETSGASSSESVGLETIDVTPRYLSTEKVEENDVAPTEISCEVIDDFDDASEVTHNQRRVQHNYHDFAHVNVALLMEKPRAGRGGVTVPFPEKLYEMLQGADTDGYEDIVSWQPHGRAFCVHKPKPFVEEVIMRHFKQTKLTSFQRQLNLYGFRRITKGKDGGAYYHELFLRGRPDLCQLMLRMKVKGTGCKAANNPEDEPNFYNMPPVVVKDTETVEVRQDFNTTESTLRTIFDSRNRSASPGASAYGHCLDTPVQTTRLFTAPVVSPESSATLTGSLFFPSLSGGATREKSEPSNFIRRHSLQLSGEDLSFPDMMGDIGNAFDDAKDFISDPSSATFV
eukprot:CAMPEP_0196815400 /NCGR_PEP_ID=MMETSP1362-20130617/49520_1 /TAXON_ID=163516 /ORGANISM="Leptocylindrus danicus, Strain CCMP1856" /LENGTH=383 /DNA_ID=CAMNT_0042192337 /DNA_START=72 /DNA_END=1223 /DNA_ORIENTATION=+